MQFFCQILSVLILIAMFFVTVDSDFQGRPGKSPAGFTGFISTMIVMGTFAAIWYGAGTFSLLLR
ncbi:MAG: hypothetical protein K8U03_09300 [Planctomycetia bacterium]|nr:hypothetical protein [Planctomycetia bacterium]